MEHFDFTAPADLFLFGTRRPGKLVYRKFSRGADAIRHAMEGLSCKDVKHAVVESDEARLGPAEIEALYWADSYPLARQRRAVLDCSGATAGNRAGAAG